jgi:glutathione S-transferase
MIKLYYSPGSCSTSCHIALEESGVEYQAIQIDWDQHTDPTVTRVEQLNPLGTLPVLILDGNSVLTQNISILTYVADLVPHKNLLPCPGTVERAESMNWLSFVAADLQKAFAPLFSLNTIVKDERARVELENWSMNTIRNYFNYLDTNLVNKEYLMGNQFTVADAYCFVVVGWAMELNIPMTPYPRLVGYLERINQRPAVQRVLRTEGLIDRAA